jgi:hypothetical protein
VLSAEAMKPKSIFRSPFLAMVLLAFVANHASAQTGVFSNLNGAGIEFIGTGAQIQFYSPGANDFQFTGGALSGLYGNLSGNFTLDTAHIWTEQVGSLEYDCTWVLGTGTLSIEDSTSHLFTADVQWVNAFRLGTAGGLNPAEVVNLSNFSYAGTNAALQSLSAVGEGTASITFQFVPALSLAQLTTPGADNTTSYSGALTAIPEPGPYAAIVGSAALFGAMLLRRRQTARGWAL